MRHRLLLLSAVGLIVMLFAWPSTATAETIAEADWWTLLADLRSAEVANEPTTDLRTQLDGITAIRRDNGTISTLTPTELGVQLDDLERDERVDLLDAWLASESLGDTPVAYDGQAELADVLSRAEFDFEERPPTLWERFWDRVREIFYDMLVRTAAIPGLPWIVAIVALVTLLFVFRMWLRGVRRQVGASDDGLFEDEFRPGFDRAAAMQRARGFADADDYRSAVRYLYLAALFSLEERELVRFDRSKTNREYIRQVANTPFAQPLRYIIDVFDRVWYGFRPIGSADYQRFVEEVERIVHS